MIPQAITTPQPTVSAGNNGVEVAAETLELPPEVSFERVFSELSESQTSVEDAALTEPVELLDAEETVDPEPTALPSTSAEMVPEYPTRNANFDPKVEHSVDAPEPEFTTDGQSGLQADFVQSETLFEKGAVLELPEEPTFQMGRVTADEHKREMTDAEREIETIPAESDENQGGFPPAFQFFGLPDNGHSKRTDFTPIPETDIEEPSQTERSIPAPVQREKTDEPSQGRQTVQMSEAVFFTPQDTEQELGEPDRALVPFELRPTAQHHAMSAGTASLPHQRELAHHVSAQMAVAVHTSESGETEITLQPEELGKVKLSMTVTDHGVQIVIAAERSDTGDLMRRHLEVLEQEFRDLGYASVDFGFSSDQQSDHTPQQTQGDPEAEQQQANTKTVFVPTMMQSDGRMDIRL